MREIKIIAEKDLEKKMCESEKLTFYSGIFNNFCMINGYSLFLVPSIVIVTVKIPWPLSSTEIYVVGVGFVVSTAITALYSFTGIFGQLVLSCPLKKPNMHLMLLKW